MQVHNATHSDSRITQAAPSTTADLREQAREAIRVLQGLLDTSEPPLNPEQLDMLEARIVRETDGVAGLIIGAHVQAAVEDPRISERGRQLVGDHPKRFASDGGRPVQIHPLRGQPVVIVVPYYRRKGGSKKKRNRGLYPALILLGIHERHTPAAGSEIALLAAAMASLKEAAHMLEQHGRSVDVKTIRSISYRYAQRARAAVEADHFQLPDTTAARRIAVSLDGGRIRIRTDKRGKKTPKGRRRYHTDLREPKLLHIWALDPQGRIDRSFFPFIDGSLQGPDHILMLLRHYLRELDVHQAEAVLFIGDGAHWIWNRIGRLIDEFGIDPKKVFQLLDFYHAVEHLAALVKLRSAWSAAVQKRWLTKHRRLLKRGCVDQLIAAISSLCAGRNGKKINKEKRYFLRNLHRLKYNLAQTPTLFYLHYKLQ